MRRRHVAVFALLLGLASIAGCTAGPASRSTPTVASGVIQVVAAEDFWGSIAAQLGGQHANVKSIISSPNLDPHEYEATSADARAVAQANYVILNGAGYDTWMQKLLDANPSSIRTVLNVAALLGKTPGDNPHFWYSPAFVSQVVDQVTVDYQAIDPRDAGYFGQQRSAFQAALQPYHQLISSINQTYAGTKIGSTESIFVYMAAALGLDLISPTAFMNAVSQGNDPPASSVVQFQQQITQRQIALLVYNQQTVTSITTNMRQLAAANGIPRVGITETISPAGATFQEWQVAQLEAVKSALESSH